MENTAAIRRTNRTPRPSAGRRSGTAQSAKKRTCGTDDNGFLTQTFQPLWLYEGEQATMEREYFNSLSNLCRFYKIPRPQTAGFPFPQNIYHSWQAVARQLEKQDKMLTCLIIADKEKPAVLSVIKPFGLRNDLFYIPVRAFWRWANCAQQQGISELLLCLFAYLHQVVEIPFYQDHDSFMYGQYESIYQWITEQDEDELDGEGKEFRAHQENTLYELSQAGAHILRQLKDTNWLMQLERVVTNYPVNDDFELEWSALAHEYLKLFKDCPGTSINHHIRPELLHPGEEERITPEQYTGFYWSGKDCFADELDEMINCSFQEIPVMDEPAIVLLFDQMPENNPQEFNYETRLFALMERLRDLLSDYDHEEHNSEF